MPINLSYSGGRDQEDQGSRKAWAKKVHETPSQLIKLGILVHAYHPSYAEKHE
jgi:hypothetical protein